MITDNTVADRLGIHDTINKYGLYINRLQVEEWVSLFTPDGVLDERAFGFENNVGQDAIRACGAILKEHVKFALHHITTVVIEELTQFEARGVVYSVVEALLNDGFHASYHVIYQDRYAKIDGRWLFRERIQRKTFEPVVFADPNKIAV